MIYIVPKS